MRKNIIVVFGLDEHRQSYLRQLYLCKKKHEDENVYITINDLNQAIGIYATKDDNFSAIKEFVNSGYDKSDLVRNKNNAENLINEFYCSLWDTLGLQENLIKRCNRQVKIEAIQNATGLSNHEIIYLLKSWCGFLNVHSRQLSLHKTLDRRNKNENKVGVNKTYNNYRAGFLAKNSFYDGKRTFLQKYGAIGKEDPNNPQSISELLTAQKGCKYYEGFTRRRNGNNFFTSSIYNNYNIENKDYFSHVFDSFLESDRAGFAALANLDKMMSDRLEKHKFNRDDLMKNRFQDNEDYHYTSIISKSFLTAFFRKTSKLAIDWVEKEAGIENSPIKGLRFYMKGYSPSNNVDNNINEGNFHHQWRHAGYKDIGSPNHISPITYSELRRVNKLTKNNKEHHIEKEYIDKFESARKYLATL
ncbi:hypothetical protein Xmau_03964 [Xenorhabdus mauleonii]|uniref:Uncharacterized protein n=1 Tax=Xenorhabdus mauleonii TaxID=351675 RepID=A0A1I3QUH0_9GAMM|nr:hypothetical protein [Xenorhabdus mauleonii]PHM37270.1 hypothetical protein Xmau_03964 [Xenorhabdus mauleonii]SFJ37370.1 hypothetical protein SAMN05421680_10823 [Xenorhabdus mauleonii]